ncbi:hypothetical protein Glove_557g3 [Diversispora epigaea]|uniref:Uncharacterized protein n=1 Tax=Diversispora epigaea TaxID=1348612 RepID=A0A397GB56_9GLOM|nr:hypothetical protein Glove_557g3 [Diversispora epigaea]
MPREIEKIDYCPTSPSDCGYFIRIRYVYNWVLCENGIGTVEDEKKAFQWYLKSAEGGDNLKLAEVGKEIGLEQQTMKRMHSNDEEKGFQCHLKSDEGGIVMEKLVLGFFV